MDIPAMQNSTIKFPSHPSTKTTPILPRPKPSPHSTTIKKKELKHTKNIKILTT
jgi:hypothetical protein